MADDVEPLLFKVTLGNLRPLNGAASDALKALTDGSMVRVEIKRTQGNIKRMGWYWVMLKIVLENISDAFEGGMTTRMLHKWLLRKSGHAKPVVSRKTGEVIDYEYPSISFANMPEHQRAEYVDDAAAVLAKALGVEPQVLMEESKQRAG